MPAYPDGGRFTHPTNNPTTMIKATLKQLQDSQPALNNLFNLDLPAKLAFKIAYVGMESRKLLDKHQPEWEAVMAQFGEKVDGKYLIPEDKREFADSAVEQFLDTEVEFPHTVVHIHVRELGMAMVKPADLARLNWLFVGEL